MWYVRSCRRRFVPVGTKENCHVVNKHFCHVQFIFVKRDSGYLLGEVYVIVNGGLIQADRDQYKPHGDGALVCNCHDNPFFLFRISVCNLGIFIQELLKKVSKSWLFLI